jgi:hypothetical protein
MFFEKTAFLHDLPEGHVTWGPVVDSDFFLGVHLASSYYRFVQGSKFNVQSPGASICATLNLEHGTLNDFSYQRLARFQNFPNLFTIFLPAGDNPLPVRVVEIFYALFRNVAGI